MPPGLADKHTDEPSAFPPDDLVREARRQKGLPPAAAPAVCVLDPDGDLVRDLGHSGRGGLVDIVARALLGPVP